MGVQCYVMYGFNSGGRVGMKFLVDSIVHSHRGRSLWGCCHTESCRAISYRVLGSVGRFLTVILGLWDRVVIPICVTRCGHTELCNAVLGTSYVVIPSWGIVRCSELGAVVWCDVVLLNQSRQHYVLESTTWWKVEVGWLLRGVGGSRSQSQVNCLHQW